MMDISAEMGDGGMSICLIGFSELEGVHLGDQERTFLGLGECILCNPPRVRKEG